jgi:DNA polymerase-3 subunit beta
MFNVKVKREALARAADQCFSVIDKRSSMDLLTKLLLKAEDGQLVLTGTDLEITLQIRIPAQVTGDGEVAVAAKTFNDFIRVATADDVVLDLADNFTLTAICGSFKTSLFGQSSESYPRTYNIESSSFNTFDARDLSDAINKTIYSLAPGDAVYNLKGVYLVRETEEEGRPKCLRLVSTDAQRLNVATVEAEELDVFSETDGILVPKKGLQKMKAICDDADKVQIGLSINNLVVKSDDSLLIVRLLDGNFPEYKGIIPTDCDLEIWLNRRDFHESVKRICILTDDKYHVAKFVFNQDLLTITSMNPELGQAEDTVGVDFRGPEIVTGFNPNFFIELLATIRSERISIRFAEGGSSFLVTAPEDPGYLGVLVSMAFDGA